MIFEHTFKLEEKHLTAKYISKLMQQTAIYHTDDTKFTDKFLSSGELAWILLNWKLEIKNPNIDSNTITIKTWTKGFSLSHIYRDFEIYDKSNNLMAIATSNWALLNFANRKPIRLTEDMINTYDCIPEKNAINEDFKKKLIFPDEVIASKSYTIKKEDLDSNGHVYNLNYLDIIKTVYNKNYSNIEIAFKKEIFFGETVICEYASLGNDDYICIKSEDMKTTHAIFKIENK